MDSSSQLIAHKNATSADSYTYNVVGEVVLVVIVAVLLHLAVDGQVVMVILGVAHLSHNNFSISDGIP